MSACTSDAQDEHHDQSQHSSVSLDALPIMVLWRGGKAFQYTVDMRQAEFRAVAQALGLDASSIDFQNALASEPQGEGHFDEGGLQYVRGCSAQEAASIAAQCVLVRQIHEVLVSGDGLEECGSAAARFPFAAHAQTLGLAAGESWKVRQRDFRFKNRSRGRAPLDSATLRALGPATDQFAGDVDLRDPQRTLWLLRGDFSCEYGRPQRSAGRRRSPQLVMPGHIACLPVAL